MKILLIDNGTLHLDELRAELEKNADEVVVSKFNQTDYKNLTDINLVILSGNANTSYRKNKEAFDREVEFIKTGRIPIIGICYGLKLIAYAFGAKPEKLDHKERKVTEIKVIKDDPIFAGRTKFVVFDAHLSYLPEGNEGNVLIPLANSNIGIEVIKHPTKPVYGFQFHPEVHINKNEGYLLLSNTIKQLAGNVVS